MLHPVKCNAKHKKILEKAGLTSCEQLLRFRPNKYYDARNVSALTTDRDGQMTAIIGILQSIKSSAAASGMMITKAYLKDCATGNSLNITWFHTTLPVEQFRNKCESPFFVYGKLQYDTQWGFSMNSPVFFTLDLNAYRKIVPVYKKRKGMSAEAFENYMESAVLSFPEEPFSEAMRKKWNLLPVSTIGRMLHFPESREEVVLANNSFHIEDLTYFAVHMHRRKNADHGELPVIKSHALMNKIIAGLPYALTSDQKKVVMEIKEKLIQKKPVNALVQGDVSCGKTITAFLLLVLAAENGYQAAMIAPTTVLAAQHYEGLSELLAPHGIKCAFLNTSLKKKEREQMLSELKEGKIQIIVGTHGLTEDTVEFQNLGMIVIDEEQRFGVEKREKLKEKTSLCPAFFSMSATPIPRTLAFALYGEGTMQFTIKSMPSGRQPVTTIRTTDFSVPQILKNQLAEGRQAYVICPLIEENPENKTNCISVEQTKRIYDKALGGTYKTGILTGKMKEQEMLSVLDDFSQNRLQVLISTTVVEVGVNNPNATVIVVQNADRFGLSSLHQLRGRVKRGSYKPYCILMAENAMENERLDALCKTEDGFELSQMDLQMRSSGDLLGTEQSGVNKHIDLLIRYPQMYTFAKLLALDLVERGEDDSFLSAMDGVYGKK